MHLELVSASAVQPNTGAAGVVIAGDSLSAKNGKGQIRIISAWQKNQVAGFGQIAFPSGHDVTRGVRTGVPIGFNLSLIPMAMALALTPQETLSLTIAGSNVAGDVESMSMLVHYEDVPGIGSRLLTAEQVGRRVEKLVTVEHSFASTANTYGTPTAITAGSDLLIANRDYAVMGISVRTSLASVYIVGPDTGNVRIGCPGDSSKSELTSQWFILLSRQFGMPTVPVINSGNKASTLIGGLVDENAGTFLATLHLALLK